MKPLVKICGISNLNFLDEVTELNNISYLGFIFYDSSPRNVTEEFLRSIADYDFRNKRPVCVYVNATEEFVNQTSSYFKNPIIQFHGDETNQFCKSFKHEFWKVIRIKNSDSINLIENYPDASAILLESYKKGVYGGTGDSFDWKIFEKSNLHHKIVLSGGINIKNVDNAICIQPWCIDINSGVESSVGVKDIGLVKDILKKF